MSKSFKDIFIKEYSIPYTVFIIVNIGTIISVFNALEYEEINEYVFIAIIIFLSIINTMLIVHTLDRYNKFKKNKK